MPSKLTKGYNLNIKENGMFTEESRKNAVSGFIANIQ